VSPKLLNEWYKDHLSDFQNSKVELHSNDIDLKPSEQIGKQTSIDVPIVKPENMGIHMAVDEKYINGEFYTLLTNGQTGKIALMAATTKAADLAQVMPLFGEKRFEVKIISRDLAPNYDWFGREQFMNAAHVADKFHVLKNAFEALQDVRIYHRQKLLTKRREAYDEFKKKKRENPQLKFVYKEPKLKNAETHRQLLARSQYLLYKQQTQWSDSQKLRAELLFNYYPDLQKAYNRVCEFRTWYAKENILNAEDNSDLGPIKSKLENWYQMVTRDDIPEMLNFKHLVERNSGAILNYFITGASNAIAESNNAKIQNLLSQNKGVKNLDFFYFRLKNFLA
jgi:transposase